MNKLHLYGRSVVKPATLAELRLPQENKFQLFYIARAQPGKPTAMLKVTCEPSEDFIYETAISLKDSRPGPLSEKIRRVI